MNELATKYLEIKNRLKELKELKTEDQCEKEINLLEESALNILSIVIKRRLELKGTLVYGLD